MLSYINTLIHSAVWHGTQVYLQCVTDSTSAQDNLSDYFREYCKSTRVRLEYYVHYEEKGFSHFPFIDHYSAKADLIFVALPIQQEEVEKILIKVFKNA